ncbi:hypothetical protein B484DRAFT_456862 [Ochromonadaceae sp. CCMP2298]|nr:hypothetical protein B484DRAFT_456862 [Ochromonadaceae sp. CCMP2298]
MNLCCGFQAHIVRQLQEQVDAFKVIVDLVKHYAPSAVPNWAKKVRELQVVTLGIRHNTLDYTDKVSWDPMSPGTPEEFAYITARDLGLPAEIRPAISNKIRETLFRWAIGLLDFPDATLASATMAPEFKVNDTKVTLSQAYQSVEMATSLWKRAKPGTVEETAAVPQPLLPADRTTNACIWLN